jgi:Ni/Fe-hydrogenase subunit HybB-like protein
MAELSQPSKGSVGTIRFILNEMKPRGKFLTPFNVISIPVILVGLVILYYRFVYGLGSVTNLNQQYPWGFWIGFDVVTGVALAGGAYVITFVVYVMKVEKYKPIVRVTVLNGLLAYIFYAGALVLDLGRPWNIVNPIIGNNFGFNSVLFLVAWEFLLYMSMEAVEFSPVIAEWMGKEKTQKVLKSLTLGAVIFGVTLSILHQSGLGSLFLMAKPKIHPLWYSEFIPIHFFVSSIFAGISMIIFEGVVSHRVLRDRIPMNHESFDKIIFGLARGAAITMFAYYFFKLVLFLHEGHWQYMGESWGFLYMFELIGLVLVPCVLFAFGARHRNTSIIKIAAILTLLGVILNRLNTSVIAFNWYAAERYFPSWQEITVTLMIIFIEIWVFRWVVTRMPVYGSTKDKLTSL